ncbi:MAG: GPP34 family phosphoprotein [Acidobacteriota bacterium]
MLSFAEELLLLALDDERGDMRDLPFFSLNGALAGAVLLELAFLQRVDYDQKQLTVLDSTATNNDILDDVLAWLAKKQANLSLTDTLSILSARAHEIRERVLKQLVARGVLKVVDKKILWVVAVRRYPAVCGTETKEIKARLRDLVLSDEVPTPRDAVLVSLVDTCSLWPVVLTPAEEKQREQRIRSLTKLELMGHALRLLLHRLSAAMFIPHP